MATHLTVVASFCMGMGECGYGRGGAPDVGNAAAARTEVISSGVPGPDIRGKEFVFGIET